MSLDLTAMIITYNEQINIQRALDSVHWVSNIIVVDSGSSDNTLDIVRRYKNTRILIRSFDSFAAQCNFGLSYVGTRWVLSMDADYVISNRVADEIIALLNRSEQKRNSDKLVSGYKVGFKYCINGRPIRSGILPERTFLYQKEHAFYCNEGHGHRVRIEGRVLRLKNKILHDDRKDLFVWIKNQIKYQKEEAKMLCRLSTTELSIQDLIRKHTCFAPLLVFVLIVIFRGGVFDGKEGMIYAFQRVIAESLLYLSIHVKSFSESEL
jgi:glycosyltransferase involved in cell wall biosynthesis